MKCSLVIPTFRRPDLLRRCLEAATSQDCDDYEVIVVDDASPDDTGAMVAREYPRVRYVRQPQNRGPAAARNRGIAMATGEVVAFTDDDCLVPSDFLRSLAESYEHYPLVAGVGGYLEAPEALLADNPWAQYESFVTHRVYGAGPQPYQGGFECPAGGTNSMSYRRDVLEAAAGFDETFPLPGGEDADLKWRVVRGGCQLLYIPLKVTHLQPYTWARFWRQYCTHGRGAVYFEQKHYGRGPSAGRLLLRLAARLARWGPNMWQWGLRMGTVRLLAELADLQGQWQEGRHLLRKRHDRCAL
jgi:glycosyltransferase involved in cell wall biosynthesis